MPRHRGLIHPLSQSPQDTNFSGTERFHRVQATIALGRQGRGPT